MHSYDVVIVGGGHNGLIAAAYLARAGRTVLVLERRDELGGAAVSFRAFPGIDVRLSRYSYLVSLLPAKIAADLGIDVELRRRNISSYTPRGDGGLLVDTSNRDRTAASFRTFTGSTHDFAAWERFYDLTSRDAGRIFESLTEPLVDRSTFRAMIADDDAWSTLFERPLGHTLRESFTDDAVRGIVLTDALIGTFATADDPDLTQNRCLLYHVIGRGTGEWNVPVGGMAAVTTSLASTARRAGATLLTGAEVLAVSPDGDVRYRAGDVERTAHGRHVLVNVSPTRLSELLGETPNEQPEGAQLKVNMVLDRLPRLRDTTVSPAEAFGGTLHVNESFDQLDTAYAEAAAGHIPTVPPCEIYCHSLTDPSILGEAERNAGYHTLTLFGLHMPARLFNGHNEIARSDALRSTLASLNSVLAEPIEDRIVRSPDGAMCIEAKTPLDLESELGMPAGHIFHRALQWPYATDPDQVGRWGVETEHDRILLCGAGARRGGGVSGIPGHNAAMAVLDSSD
jgi:phytoene dehydrogenase-like protein